MPTTGTYLALLRGINVGRAKALAMADLRELLTDLGYTDVRTHLRSGNAIFGAGRAKPAAVQTAIEEQLQQRYGMSVRVLVRTGPELAAVVERNGLPTTDGSRLLVAFLDRALPEPTTMDRSQFAPEDYQIGEREVFLWCPNGINESAVVKAFSDKRIDRVVTARNWNTVVKLLELMRAGA